MSPGRIRSTASAARALGTACAPTRARTVSAVAASATTRTSWRPSIAASRRSRSRLSASPSTQRPRSAVDTASARASAERVVKRRPTATTSGDASSRVAAVSSDAASAPSTQRSAMATSRSARPQRSATGSATSLNSPSRGTRPHPGSGGRHDSTPARRYQSPVRRSTSARPVRSGLVARSAQRRSPSSPTASLRTAARRRLKAARTAGGTADVSDRPRYGVSHWRPSAMVRRPRSTT